MKKNSKLTLICFSMCSLFAFTGLKAQDVITEEFYVDEIRESPIRFHDFSDFYISLGKRLVVERIGDHQRDQLLREVIRAVVIGATADRYR